MTGKKSDGDKLPLYIVMFEQFPLALSEVAKCSLAGHKKYELNGDWQNFARVTPPKRYLDAMLRHLQESGAGLKVNEDGDVFHLAQVARNALAYLQILLNEKDSSKEE